MLAPGPSARLVAGLLALAAGAVGCGGDSEDSADRRPAQVETTKVRVVEGLGAKDGFDPTALYRRLSPGVVTVISLFDGAEALVDGDGEGGQGSGFVLDDDGYIATNAHVVTTGRPPRTRRAKEVFVEFSDGNRVPAKVVGDDPFSDVAVLKVDPKGLSLTPLELAGAGDARVGEPVAAIGSPFGENQSLSIGVISAVDRAIESLTAFQIGDAIQTDAAINPGNSGGPLLNAKGRVLGINAQIKSESGGGEGVGFAIPVGAVRRSIEALRENGKVEYGYLGVSTQTLYPQLAERLDVPFDNGALVRDVEDDSPAEDADIEAGGDKIEFQGARDIPADGDVIVAVNGRKLTRTVDLADLVSRRRPGEKVELEVWRDGDRRTVEVELGKRPNRPPQQRPGR
jgi:S1-C subfamily serine protease